MRECLATAVCLLQYRYENVNCRMIANLTTLAVPSLTQV